MDIVLQKKVKNLAICSFKNLKKLQSKQDGFIDYLKLLDSAMQSVEALQIFQENYIKHNMDFKNIKTDLKYFISNIITLSASMRIIHEQNIKLTKQALKKKDDSLYNFKKLDNEKIVNLKTNTKQINAFVEKIVLETEKRYTKQFGEFENLESLNKFLSKEFEETKTYLADFEKIKNIEYRTYDNLERIYISLDSLATEAIQFNAVLIRAERFLSQNQTDKKEYKPYYVIMDGINSSKHLFGENPNYYNNLKENTEKLNKAIKSEKNMDVICNFMAYKQDEIHGVFNGDIKDFTNLVSKVYENTNLKLAFSDKNITNIKEVPYGIPFDLYGPACLDCRNQIENKQNLITVGNVCNDNANDLTY